MKRLGIGTIYSAFLGCEVLRPLCGGAVAAGFPSPAEDYIDSLLDLNKHLIQHPAATYFIRVTGDSMVGAGIGAGDLLVVDRAVQAGDKDVVVANIDGELTVKRIRLCGGKVLLVPENESYRAQEVSEGMEFSVWGVVRHVIRSM